MYYYQYSGSYEKSNIHVTPAICHTITILVCNNNEYVQANKSFFHSYRQFTSLSGIPSCVHSKSIHLLKNKTKNITVQISAK